ncbi:nuclear transport factor 2 family protein [Nocardioides furvisabuli]
MDDQAAVVSVAEARADALVRGDAAQLLVLHHPGFRRTTHTGQVFDRAEYVARNTRGTTCWGRRSWRPQRRGSATPPCCTQRWLTWCWLLTVSPRPSGCPMSQVWVRDGGGVVPRRPCRPAPRGLTTPRRRMGTCGRACRPASSWVAGCGAGSSSR